MSIGYACITIGVENTGLSRCILKNATEDKLRKIIESNLVALETMIDYNIVKGISLFRISSDIIPFASHPVNQVPWWNDYKNQFQAIGQKIRNAKIRVSMHPGQYTVLNSPDEEVVRKAIAELEYHRKFLEALEVGSGSKLVLHIGGVYGDKEKAMETFIEKYQVLPDGIKKRLVIENDDKNYNIEEVLFISETVGAPVVFDNLHHKVNPPKKEEDELYWVMKSRDTWKEQDGGQKIHYSQQKEGGSPGSHSDTIAVKEFQEFYHQLPDKEIDIMLEVKDKNLSAVKCIHGMNHRVTKEALQKEWKIYYPFVLSRSSKLVSQIEEILKKDNHNAMDFYEKIEEALFLPEDKRNELFAVRHIWDMISENCSNPQWNRYEKLLNSYQAGNGQVKPLKSHLFKCAHNVGVPEEIRNFLYFHL